MIKITTKVIVLQDIYEICTVKNGEKSNFKNTVTLISKGKVRVIENSKLSSGDLRAANSFHDSKVREYKVRGNIYD